MKYLVPDSVADEIHEREIPDQLVAGLPLAMAVAIIDVYDGYGISGNDFLTELPANRGYDERDGVGILDVNTDRSHYYGIVFSPTDQEAAKAEAERLLKSWNEDEDDENENDED